MNGPAVYTLQDIEIVEVSMENYHESVQDLMQNPMTEVKKLRNGISGKVTNKEDGILWSGGSLPPGLPSYGGWKRDGNSGNQ